ncbi:hypothetical protein IQ07DRAFT_675781 [Pyrenochaeta sp. DS3sAY3a]|nr:hypothetical protein IQ07DRAFT_675781 [Pyrenochaeta sp. DS3sAY3a]
MLTTFPMFPKLPAELRSAIYGFALQDEHDQVKFLPARKIEFYKFDPSIGSISVRISQPYPKLLAVNRETRSETAKIYKYGWMTVNATPRGQNAVSGTPRFEVAIDFNKDHVLILDRFLAKDPHHSIWRNQTLSIEHYRLKLFTQLLPVSTINRMKQISIQVLRPHIEEHHGEGGALWRGEGLEVFRHGALERVILVGLSVYHEMAQDHVQDYLERHWVTDGRRTQPPLVKGRQFKFIDNWLYMNENLTQGSRPRNPFDRDLTLNC